MIVLRNLGFSIAVALAGATSAFADEPVTTLTFSAWLPPVLQECGPFQAFQTMAEKSGGRLLVEAVKDPAKRAVPGTLYDQLAAGEVDIVWEQAYTTPDRFPLTDLVMLPFTVADPKAASRALHGLVPGHLAEEFEDVHLIALHVTAPFGSHMRAPIRSIDDAAGRRVRAAGAPGMAIVKALGAEPVPLPGTELYDALANGRIDGLMVDPAAPIAVKLVDVVHHHLFADMMVAPIYLAMNKATYERLPPDLQAAVDAVATPDTAAAIAACFGAGYDEALAAVRARPDHTVVVLDETQRAAARERLRAAIDQPIADLEAKGRPARAFYDALVVAIAEEERRR